MYPRLLLFFGHKTFKVKLTVVSLVREVPLVFVEVAEKAASEVQPFAFWKRQNVLFLLFLIKFHVSRSAPGRSMNRNKLSKKSSMTSTKIFTRLCRVTSLKVSNLTYLEVTHK